MANKKKPAVEATLTEDKNKVIIASERRQVAEMLKKGASIEQIALKLGLNEGVIKTYEQDLVEEWDREVRNKVHQIKAKDFALLDESLKIVTEAIYRSEDDKDMQEAVKTQLMILKRRAEMIGYDAATKLDVTSEGEKIVPLAIIGMNMEDL